MRGRDEDDEIAAEVGLDAGLVSFAWGLPRFSFGIPKAGTARKYRCSAFQPRVVIPPRSGPLCTSVS